MRIAIIGVSNIQDARKKGDVGVEEGEEAKEPASRRVWHDGEDELSEDEYGSSYYSDQDEACQSFGTAYPK
jgi:hypothetical protein